MVSSVEAAKLNRKQHLSDSVIEFKKILEEEEKERI